MELVVELILSLWSQVQFILLYIFDTGFSVITHFKLLVKLFSCILSEIKNLFFQSIFHPS
jgi:uncharacterized protein with von Willebrand factor type A (vWA) domain